MVGGIAFHKHNFRLRIFGDFLISAGNFSISIAKKHRPWFSNVYRAYLRLLAYAKKNFSE